MKTIKTTSHGQEIEVTKDQIIVNLYLETENRKRLSREISHSVKMIQKYEADLKRFELKHES